MSHEPLTPGARDVAEIAAARPLADGFLVDLIDLAERGLQSPVALLMNGMIIFGVLAPRQAMADAVDKVRRRMAESTRDDVPSDKTAEEWQEQLDRFATSSSTAAADIEADFHELEADVAQYLDSGSNLEDAPAALARRLIEFSARRFLTLQDVQITAPGQAGIMRVAALRVAISEVTGWWPVQLDEDGSANVSLFSTER